MFFLYIYIFSITSINYPYKYLDADIIVLKKKRKIRRTEGIDWNWNKIMHAYRFKNKKRNIQSKSSFIRRTSYHFVCPVKENKGAGGMK